MILSDSAILEEIANGNIVISPFDRSQLGSNSYDVRLGKWLRVYDERKMSEGWDAHGLEWISYIDAKKDNPTIDIEIPEDGFILMPDMFYLGATLEYTETHIHVPYIEGKCFIKGTLVKKFDGTLCPIEDVKVGDKIATRNGFGTVTSLHSGKDQMYEIQQSRGINYTVNSKHILTLVATKNINNSLKKGEHRISVEDFIKLPLSNQILLNGFKKPVFYTHKALLIDPYILGIWLGDGCSSHPRLTINNNDVEIIEYIKQNYPLVAIHQYKTGAKTIILTSHAKTEFVRPNDTLTALRKLNLIKNKHIPEMYLKSSLAQRLELLAGIIDTDGYVNNCCYEIILERKALFDDVVKLANSCGFTCNPAIKVVNGKDYYRTTITGEVSKIPLKNSRKRDKLKTTKVMDKSLSKIKVTNVGEGFYYGFSLDGNNDEDVEFFLSDNTVVHNSSTGRLSIDIHATAAKGDVNFRGYFTLELSCKVPVKIYAGMPIGQITYFKVDGEVLQDYASKPDAKYSNQGSMPLGSQMYKNFKP